MLRLQLRKAVALLALLALGVLTVGVAGAASTDGDWLIPGQNRHSVETLRFDVAEDMTRFAYDPDNTFEEDGMPAHGSYFVTQGYIYPAGTLNGSNGVNMDGSPEFPDQVIGSWTCYGTFIGDGAHATTGAWVVTTQIYNFGHEYGDSMIVTDGFELADTGVSIERAITGGTDEYANARGEAEQVFLGFNASEGVNISYELNVDMR